MCHKLLYIFVVHRYHFEYLSYMGCFCHWTFFLNIGFNMLPSDSFISNLCYQLAYSIGKFRALQSIAPSVVFGAVD